VPEHTVIARFRRRHSARMAEVFRHVLKICHEAGLVRLGLVALDGTKVQANAAGDANRTAESIDAQIKRMMDEAETTVRQEDDRHGSERGDEVPADRESIPAACRSTTRWSCTRKTASRCSSSGARAAARMPSRPPK
jgi:predicted phage gp36 major capsid-like protein